MTHLIEGLRPFSSRARSQEALVWGLRATALGLSWALLVEIAARLRPQPNSLQIILAGAAILLLASWAMWSQHQPSPDRVARLVDARLKYHERVATALAFEGTEGPLVDRLNADAVAHLRIGDPKQVFPLQRHRAAALVCSIAALSLAALVVSPNPQEAVLAKHEADRATVKKVTQQIARLKQQAANKADVSDTKRRELEKALAMAEAGLRKTQSPRGAVAQISNLLDRLAKLHDPAVAGLVAGAADAAGALSPNPRTKPLSDHLNQANLKASAADLGELAKTLDKLSPEENQALASAMTAASSQNSGNPEIQAAFGKAGATLFSGDSRAGSDQLSSLSQLLASLAGQQSFEALLGQAQSAAGQAQQQAAQQADSGSQGQGQGQGQGEGQGQGGHGAGSGGGSARNQPGEPAERVFVKGKPGAGLNEPLPGPLGPGTSLPLRSFREVLGQFQAFELETLARGTVSLEDRDLVRRYFSSLH